MSKPFTYYVYILASKKKGTLYIGMTDNLIRRVIEHKEKIHKGFTEKYNVNKLVYYEIYNDIKETITREKNIKKWKIELIEENNKNWDDLLYQISEINDIEEIKKDIRKNYHNK